MAKGKVFSASALFSVVKQFPPHKRLLVGFSGGCDSSVLLHTLAALRQRQSSINILAIYIDHGLADGSAQWGDHCKSFCAKINIPFYQKKVNVRLNQGQSPEEAARNARYDAFRDDVRDGDALVTAHHADDQAETLLLQMLRGSGPKGLAAMADCTRFGKGYLLRPLLNFTRAELEQYAMQHTLHWIEDPSNAADRYDRNYLRNTVMPLLSRRWPAVSELLGRVAAHQAEACRLMATLAKGDFAVAKVGDCLDVTVLLELDQDRQRNLLRYWIQFKNVVFPSVAIMEQILLSVVEAKDDRSPLLEWGGYQLRRYRKKLYLDEALSQHDAAVLLLWNGVDPLELPSKLGVLRVRQRSGVGLGLDFFKKNKITVRFRRGGERIKPCGQSITHDLKKLFQSKAIPPWLRHRIPLIFVGGELAAVVGFWLADSFAAKEGEDGLEIFVDNTLRVE